MEQEKMIRELWKLFIEYYVHGGIDAGLNMWGYSDVLNDIPLSDIEEFLEKPEGKTLDLLYEKYKGVKK